MRWPVIGLCVFMFLLPACAPPAERGGFDSDNPASKLYAIRRAGEARDRAAVPPLVEELGSDDPAVRMMAIQALEQITDTRLGYNPYAALAERDAATARWAEAVREGRFDQPAPASAPSP